MDHAKEEPGIDNPGCVRVVRLVQSGMASQDDLVFLWQQTVAYLHKGLEVRSRMSSHDPSMSVEDLEQELFIRVPKWAMTFPKSMSNWPQWIRSCWFRWIINHSQHHGRHRPRCWVQQTELEGHNEGFDFEGGISDPKAKEPGEESPAQNVLQDLFHIMDDLQSACAKEWQLASRKYLALRVVGQLSIEQAAEVASKKWTPEHYRQMELKVLGIYDPGMGKRDSSGRCLARRKPRPDV